PNNTANFENVINSAGQFQAVVPSTDTLDVDTSIQAVVGSEDYFCTRKTVSATEAPGEFPLFDPNADIIYPGNLLQGASLDNATPDPIPVKRGPGTVVMVIDNGADSVSRTIPEMSLSGVFNAKNQIIAENPGILPARFAFTFEQVYSREQLALALDVSFENLYSDVTSSLSFSTDQEYNRFMVKLDQSYFTIAYQLPTSIAEIFDPSVTPQQLAQYVGPGNPAAFISSVTYGRKFYLLIESTSSRTEMDASINASFGAAVTQGTIGGNVKYVSQLENVRIKAYALGGEQGAALGAITSNFDSLKSFLARGGDIRTGVALSYVVRSLAQPDKIVKVKVATEYDIVNCVPVGESVENPIVWYKADQGVTTATTSKLVTRWANFFSKPEFDALPPTKAYGGQLIDNALPGPNLPAVKFLPNGASISNEGMLGFSGVNFVGKDFTMWFVGRLESQFSTYPEMFFFGSGTTPGSNFKVGFRNSNQLTISNHFDTLNVATTTPVDSYKLYTIRFSRINGLEVFENGSLTPKARDAGMNQALSSFLGARIGTQNGNALYLAEIKAYGTAVSELQRQSLDKALLVKYGL
ncbi:MAG: thiol-activated cytolysin family protein, partial [Candidatus Zixiibacteriota bacterium]